MNPWFALLLAILLEVTATLSLKSAGPSNLPASTVVVLRYLGSFVLLTVVLRSLEIGTTYAVWAGSGTALIALIGMGVLGETVSVGKVASLVFIVVGVVGLNLSSAH